MTIGVVIVTHNSKDYIGACITSLRSEGVTNTVVVDSASTDDTLQDVNALHVQVIALSENKGFGYAANRGAQHMNTDYVLFINPDAYLETGALRCIQDFLKRVSEAGVIGMMLQDTHGMSEHAGYGYEPSLIRLMHRIVIPVLSAGWRTGSTPFQIDWVSGGAMVVKKAVFDQLGGFDERFFLYWEDVDFCRRVRQAGYSVWVHPQARAIHIRGASQADAALKTRIYDMSADRYYKKHYSTTIWLIQRALRKIYRIVRPEAR